ncbi:MAG: ankyrin repeat domain-containing protein [Spirochaetales bacterium]|nr:ankyrin repeat domain-containing protein [Spirochaetales bacterium]
MQFDRVKKYFEAIRTGNISLVRKMTDEGMDPDKPYVLYENDSNLYSPVTCAAESGRDAIVRLLIKKGVHLNPETGCSALSMAAYHGHHRIVKRLLSHNADIDYSDSFGTALMHAVFEGYVRITKTLLSSGCMVNFQNDDGLSALHIAAERGHVIIKKKFPPYKKILKMLLAAGAHPDLQDDSGYTALMYATFAENTEAIKVLLDANADISIKNMYDKTAMDIAEEKGGELINLYRKFKRLPE